MSLALPLRILLVLVLVLNGIGGAMAGVSAGTWQRMTMTAHAAVDVHAPAEDAGCHDGAGPAAPADPHPVPAGDCHPGEDGECAASAECRQACMHGAAAVACPPGVGVAVVHGAPVVAALAIGHPAPPLRGVIRPPIA